MKNRSRGRPSLFALFAPLIVAMVAAVMFLTGCAAQPNTATQADGDSHGPQIVVNAHGSVVNLPWGESASAPGRIADTITWHSLSGTSSADGSIQGTSEVSQEAQQTGGPTEATGELTLPIGPGGSP